MLTVFRNVMRENVIISTSGRSYVGVDKKIEFNINFQKNYFTSKGVHGSWDLLSNLAPNMPIFRHLKMQFGDFLGAPWQGVHHTKVNTNDQVAKVQLKMSELHLDKVNAQRVTEHQTIDIIETGATLPQKTGIKKFAKSYMKWRDRK
ncbi:hypothetical protein B0H19DRAFT_924831 [Mycena capillaripes]|nr:hypothetical protein B0H19DRAFT_924831 [Mycena capillaripes]